jgi:hypothetical protein
MQLSKNTSSSKQRGFLIKVALFLVIFFVGVIMLSKIDLPSPNKIIEKNISNEKLKIVK